MVTFDKNPLFYPLSQWYKNNVVSLYNYYEEDMDQMRTIITYQTWLFSLRTASQYADDGTISVILKSFKRLIESDTMIKRYIEINPKLRDNIPDELIQLKRETIKLKNIIQWLCVYMIH